MARIMSKIPTTLNNIIAKYDIELGIFNKRTNYDIDYIIGTENIAILNHGTYEEILNKLLMLRLEILEEYQKVELGERHEQKR